MKRTRNCTISSSRRRIRRTELAKGALDFVLARGAVDAERGVVILVVVVHRRRPQEAKERGLGFTAMIKVL
jgi:hypothetical protein